MSNNNDKIHTIIHGAAAAAAAAATGLAQIPGSDNAVITPIQVAMIIAIGEVHGQQLSMPRSRHKEEKEMIKMQLSL